MRAARPCTRSTGAGLRKGSRDAAIQERKIEQEAHFCFSKKSMLRNMVVPIMRALPAALMPGGKLTWKLSASVKTSVP